MQLFSILGNSQKLDGGAMYGNCPKTLWNRWSPADERNRISLACRALLIRDGARRILVETGIGAYLQPSLRERYGVAESEHVLLESLSRLSMSPDDITHVVISHLHFDHAGGLLSAYQEGEEPELLFSNAEYIVGARAFERARHPRPRDRASFIPQLTEMLENTGRLRLVTSHKDHPFGPDYRLRFSDGHTVGMTHLEICSPFHMVFVADLIPGTPWVNAPITMGYDRYPELIVEEKQALLEDFEESGGWIIYTHDPKFAMSRVRKNQKGKYEAFEMIEKLDGWGGHAGGGLEPELGK